MYVEVVKIQETHERMRIQNQQFQDMLKEKVSYMYAVCMNVDMYVCRSGQNTGDT
jgi:hypothetical protein